MPQTYHTSRVRGSSTLQCGEERTQHLFGIWLPPKAKIDFRCEKPRALAREACHSCTVCEEAIYNPICPNCLLREFDAWLAEQNASEAFAEELADELDTVLVILASHGRQGDCAVCRQTIPFSIDPYCFTKAMFDVLKNADRNLAARFVRYFSYDFEQTSYENKKYEF